MRLLIDKAIRKYAIIHDHCEIYISINTHQYGEIDMTSCYNGAGRFLFLCTIYRYSHELQT